MKYKTQQIAYWFFALSMLLFTLQLTYGFIMGFAHMGFDGLHDFIPFNAARATHNNLLIVWILSGFMGAAYYIIPDEAEHEIVAPKLAYIQLITFALVGVVCATIPPGGGYGAPHFGSAPHTTTYKIFFTILSFFSVTSVAKTFFRPFPVVKPGLRFLFTQVFDFFSDPGQITAADFQFFVRMMQFY